MVTVIGDVLQTTQNGARITVSAILPKLRPDPDFLRHGAQAPVKFLVTAVLPLVKLATTGENEHPLMLGVNV